MKGKSSHRRLWFVLSVVLVATSVYGYLEWAGTTKTLYQELPFQPNASVQLFQDPKHPNRFFAVSTKPIQAKLVYNMILAGHYTKGVRALQLEKPKAFYAMYTQFRQQVMQRRTFWTQQLHSSQSRCKDPKHDLKGTRIEISSLGAHGKPESFAIPFLPNVTLPRYVPPLP